MESTSIVNLEVPKQPNPTHDVCYQQIFDLLLQEAFFDPQIFRSILQELRRRIDEKIWQK